MSKHQHILDQIPAAKSTDELSRILLIWPGQLSDVVSAIARKGRVFDLPLIQTLISTGVSVADLIRNPAFPRDADDVVATWLANRMQGESDLDRVTSAAYSLGILFDEQRVGVHSESYRILKQVLTERRSKMTNRQYHAAVTMLRCPDTPEEDLRMIFKKMMKGFPHEAPAFADILTHANTPMDVAHEYAPEIASWNLYHRDYLDALMKIVESDRLRCDEVVRGTIRKAAVRRSVIPAIGLLAQDGMSDCMELIRILLLYPQGYDAAAKTIRAHGHRLISALSQSEIASLLSHQHHAIRLATIVAYGTISNTETLERSDPSSAREKEGMIR